MRTVHVLNYIIRQFFQQGKLNAFPLQQLKFNEYRTYLRNEKNTRTKISNILANLSCKLLRLT